MARTVSSQRKIVNTVVAWTIGVLIFFPILWTVPDELQDRGRGDRLAAVAVSSSTGRSRTISRSRRGPTISSTS